MDTLNKENMEQNALCNAIKVHLGNLEIFIFSDGHAVFNNGQPTLAPAIPEMEYAAAMESLHLRKEVVDMGINIMLIKNAHQNILIDAGMGTHFENTLGKLLENLIHTGISPDSITDVVITHAHRDHIGGLISKDNTFVFPNAKYHIAKEEYNFWMSENPDFSNSKLRPEQIKGMIAFTKKIIRQIEEKLEKFNAGDTLFGLIQTELAVGHTPGHTIFTIISQGKSLKNIVDIFHTPLMVMHPDWGASLDTNFEEGIKTRKRITEQSFKNKNLLMSAHLPWPGLGYIEKNDSYYWNPLSYYYPTEIRL